MLWLLIIVWVILLTFVRAGIGGAPFVPTRKKDVERFLRLAEIEPGQKMYDLGCGDGRLVFAAAKAGADAIGLEISLIPYVLAQTRRLFQKDRLRIKIVYKNLWKADLSDADLVYVWLMPKVVPKIKAKLERELKPGTRVISYVWPIDGMNLLREDKEKGSSDIFLYQT